MTNIIKKNILGLIGVLVGAIGGYAYFTSLAVAQVVAPLLPILT